VISQFSLHSSQFPLPPFTIHHSQFTIPFCWDMDLAVKSPRAEILGSEMAVRRFLREAETWIQLGPLWGDLVDFACVGMYALAWNLLSEFRR
jgi:hypothetical protein